MADLRYRVRILPRRGVLDPQGEAVRSGLHHLGFAGVSDVRIGKVIEVRLSAEDAEAGRQAVEEMARRLLANPVMEDFVVEPVGEA